VLKKIAKTDTLCSFRTPQCAFPTFTGGSANFPGGSNPPDKSSPDYNVVAKQLVLNILRMT